MKTTKTPEILLTDTPVGEPFAPALDPDYLMVNIMPSGSHTDFETKDWRGKSFPTRTLPRLGTLFERLENPFFRTHTMGYVPLDKQAPLIQAVDDNDQIIPLKHNSDLLYQGIDPNHFIINGRIFNKKESVQSFLNNEPEIAWRAYTSSGFIQVTSAARKQYGLNPKNQAEVYPKTSPNKNIMMEQFPNINFFVATPEEAEWLRELFDNEDLRHNFIPGEDQAWGSAISEGKIYSVLSPNTSIFDSEQKQHDFMRNILGDELTPDREERVMADGGYANLIAYLLLKLVMESAYTSLSDYQFKYPIKIRSKDYHHTDPSRMMELQIDQMLKRLAYSTYSILCNNGL